MEKLWEEKFTNTIIIPFFVRRIALLLFPLGQGEVFAEALPNMQRF